MIILAALSSVTNLIGKVCRRYKELGAKGFIRMSLNKAAGTTKHQEEIDTLYYLLNHYIDITKYPPAKGALRKMQLCDAVLLNTFAEICEREGWTYWLDGGTLLGAVRHKGFIPWDDDMDVAMPREDYNKAMKKLPEIFASYGKDSLTLYRSNPMHLGFGYMHLQTGVWCDIFPLDTVNADMSDIETLTKKAIEYKKFYDKHKDNLTQEDIIKAKRPITNVGGGAKLGWLDAELSFRPYFLEWDSIFPLSTLQFEGYTLNVPNNTHKYLTLLYGDYMLFPRDGLEHHDCGRGALSGWAERNGINMDEVLAHLKDIERFFKTGA